LDGLKYSFSKLVSVNSVVSASRHHNYFDLTSTFDFIREEGDFYIYKFGFVWELEHPIPFDGIQLTWQGYAAPRSRLVLMGADQYEVDHSISNLTRFVKVPKVSEKNFPIISLDVFITPYNFSEFPLKDDSLEPYKIKKFFHPERLSRFLPNSNLQCDNRCRFFSTPAFPNLTEIITHPKSEKQLIEEMRFSWLQGKTGAPQDRTEIIVQKPEKIPTLWDRVLGKLPVENVTFEVVALEDQIIKPNDSYVVNLYLTAGRLPFRDYHSDFTKSCSEQYSVEKYNWRKWAMKSEWLKSESIYVVMNLALSS